MVVVYVWGEDIRRKGLGHISRGEGTSFPNGIGFYTGTPFMDIQSTKEWRGCTMIIGGNTHKAP
jgi:hypothetical protein